MILSFVMCGWSSKCLFQITHRKLNFTDRWMLECLSAFPSQTTWMLLQMSRNCGKAATLVWHSILLLLANISQADFMRWTYINHSLHTPIGKSNSKIQSTAEKTHTIAKEKKPKPNNKTTWDVYSAGQSKLESDVKGQPVLLFLTLPLQVLGNTMSSVCYFWFMGSCISTSCHNANFSLKSDQTTGTET